MLSRILEKIDSNEVISIDEVIYLLKIRNGTGEYIKLLNKANKLSRKEYRNRGYVFVRTEIKECVSVRKHNLYGDFEKSGAKINSWKYLKQEFAEILNKISLYNVDDLVISFGESFKIDDVVETGEYARETISNGMNLVAAINDIDYESALKIRRAGYNSVFYLKNLSSDINYDINDNSMLKTLSAIKRAGLDFHYSIGEIKRDYDYEIVARELIKAREYNISSLEIRRCPNGITDDEFMKIISVARLIAKPTRCIAGRNFVDKSLAAGGNQIFIQAVNSSEGECEDSKKNTSALTEAEEMLNKYKWNTKINLI